MSYTDDFYNSLEKKKNKKDNSASNPKTFSSIRWNETKRVTTKDDDDIAPVSKKSELLKKKEELEDSKVSFWDFAASLLAGPFATEEMKEKRENYVGGHNDYVDRKTREIDKELAELDGKPYVNNNPTVTNLTQDAFMRGVYNSKYGQESFKQMTGIKNNKEYYADKLNEDEYSFVADDWYEKILSGASEQLGQWFVQYTDPKTVSGAAALAGTAALAGQAGPQVALPEEVVTVPSAALIGLKVGAATTAFEIEAGHAYNEMIENGISHKTASILASGAGIGIAALETMQLDDLAKSYKILSKTDATKSAAKTVLEYLTKRGINIASETAQEVAQEGVTIGATQVGSKIDKGEWAYNGKEIKDRLIDTAEQSAWTFAGLGVGGDIASYGGNKIMNRNTNEESELSDAEYKVVSKVAENEIAEREANGEKLSTKEKNEIYDSVVEKVENGSIGIDTIEEILGGESYETYKKATDENASLKKELDELNDIKASDLTGKQSDRLAELKGMNLDDTTKTTELKNKLSNDVFNLVKSDRNGQGSILLESYREKARRSEAFTADLTKYTGKQKEAVERAINSGVLNNTNRSHELVNILSKIEADKGIAFDYTNNAKLKETGFAIDGKTVNGFVNNGGVTLNMESSKAWESTVGHEITHILEGTDSYSELQNVLFKYAKSKGELETRRAELTKLYNGIDADIDAELTADLVGDYLFTDKNFVKHLTSNRNLFQKVYDEIKYLWNVATGKEKAQIEKVMREFDKAWDELSTKDTNEATDAEIDDVKYSVSVEDKGTLDFLNEQVSRGEYDAETNPNGGYYVTYKSMSYWGTDEDGNIILRSPMAEYVDGELSNAYLIPKDKSKLNWYQATETIDENTGLPSGLMVKTKKEGNKSFTYLPASENQDLINEDWSNLYFNLQKKVLKNGKWVKSDVPARYNPYEHSSNSMLNDQFSAAYLRDNLVTVKMYVPISEDNGTFRAKYSKDGTGWADWKTGTVAGKINKQKDLQRKVYLSRYAAPVEIVPDSEVAQAYKEYLEGTDVAIPDNVVSPNLLNELKKAGVPITESGKVKYSVSDVTDADGNELSLAVQNKQAPIINNLTGREISKESYSVLERLGRGESATLEELNSLPEVIEGSEKVEQYENEFLTTHPELQKISKRDFGTNLIDSAEREQLRNNILQERLKSGSFTGLDKNGKEVYNGSVEKGKRLDIVIGLPAAGKSTSIVNPLSQYYKSVVADSDIIKEQLPEFNKGWGATLVHKESSVLNMRMLDEELALGNNIVLPIVGANKSSVENYIELAKLKDYDVHIHLNELNSSKAMGRMLGRFFSDGRFIPPFVSYKYGDLPTLVYQEIKNRSDISGYSHWNNDVPKGQRPTHTDSSENNRPFREYSEKWRAIRGTNVERNDSESEGGKIQSNQIAPIKASSIDGVFFDGEKPDIRFSLSENTDNEYMLAVKNGDMETAQRLVNEAAEKSGYTTNSEYRGNHYAPYSQIDKESFTDLDKLQELCDEGSDLNLFAIANGISNQPDDYFGVNGARWYGYNDADGMESYRAIKSAMNSIQRQMEQYGEVREMPTVKVYRAVPKSVKESKLQSGGQWVTPSYLYAKMHGEHSLNGKYKIIEETVSAENLWWDANDIREWGFDDGTNYAYRDTKNNRKLLDAVTYDDEGNIIPLSKRFNFRNADERFSLSPEGEQIAPIGTPLKDLYLEQGAPIREGVAENATTTNEAPMPNNSTPISTRLADGTRGDELLYESLDNYPMGTVEQKVAEKIRSVEAELADNRDLRREAETNYNKQIAKLQEEYNAKKNKNTIVANNLLKSISRLEGLKARVDADFAKRISDLEARAEKMKDPKYSRAMYKKAKMEEHAKFAEDLLGDTSTWVDKKLGLQYETNTERRNLRDIVRDENGNPDIARADAINDALGGQYNREEAAKKRELARVRGKYADLKITKAEDTYAQMLGELRHNPDTTLTEQVVSEYYDKHKNKIDKAKVEKIIDLARKDYDDLLNRVNEKLREQGMKEIPYRKGYFPHFTDVKQNFIQKLLNWKTQNNEIPTSIAGLTEDFKPVKSWQSFDKTRYSDETDYSFTKGFDNYSQGALDWIYHLETLQKRRAVENHIRFTHSEEGIKARIKEVYANEELDADEAQAQIEHILREAKNPLNNFVQDFMTKTNILAGKKNSLDRAVEQKLNRNIYSVMTNVQNRMSANMVLANIRSALTNFIPITQSWAQVSPVRSLQATKDTIANAIKDDGLTNKSTFLTNRLREADNLYQTNWDKVLDYAGIMFEVVDNFSSQVIWRSKYNQNLANGMSETEAIANADQFAENVMAGRSKGNEPTLFNAKNPLVKAFTMFQLEVNNQYGYLFKDVPNDLKAETNHWKLNLAKGYATAFVGAYVYNEILSKLTGSDAALDPIGIIEDLLRDLGLFDDDEEKEPDEVVTNLVDNVVQELPFVGGLFGGGRIPISSAIPYGGEYGGGLTGAIEDVTEGNWKNIGKELMKPVLNIGLPVGGGQIKKTVQGLKMFSDEHPVSGSYTDSGSLRFPVEDTPLNRIQAGLFGQYASENAREYFDNGYAPLKEKQIQEYQDVDLPIGDYWKYREGLSGLKTNEEKANYINSLDIKDWQKNLLLNNILDRKEDVDMSNYDDYNDWEEFDYAQKNPEKYAFSKSVGGYSAYKTYSDELYNIKADKDENGKSINGSRKEKVIDYINNLDADYETKIILYKSEYPSDDTYNYEIIEYLNNRQDLTYEERVSIYTELGFTVKDGYVYWD